MNDETPRKSWGSGRVAFMARLDTIKSEMSQGHPLTAIFERHQTALGIGYPSFCKLVSRYADDAKLTPRRASTRAEQPVPTPAPAPSPKPRPPAPVASAAQGTTDDARHKPAARPTFQHHGVTQEGEPEQLLGPGFLPKRRG